MYLYKVQCAQKRGKKQNKQFMVYLLQVVTFNSLSRRVEFLMLITKQNKDGHKITAAKSQHVLPAVASPLPPHRYPTGSCDSASPDAPACMTTRAHHKQHNLADKLLFVCCFRVCRNTISPSYYAPTSPTHIALTCYQ